MKTFVLESRSLREVHSRDTREPLPSLKPSRSPASCSTQSLFKMDLPLGPVRTHLVRAPQFPVTSFLGPYPRVSSGKHTFHPPCSPKAKKKSTGAWAVGGTVRGAATPSLCTCSLGPDGVEGPCSAISGQTPSGPVLKSLAENTGQLRLLTPLPTAISVGSCVLL